MCRYCRYLLIFVFCCNILNISESQIFHTTTDHDHQIVEAKNLNAKPSTEMITEIALLHKGNMKPSFIVQTLTLSQQNGKYAGQVIPTLKRMQYIVNNIRKKTAAPIVSIGELIAWCEVNTTVSPLDKEKPIVIQYTHSEINNDLHFRFALTSLALLSNCVGVSQICIDATYKLNWNGFPLLVLGTVDRSKRFHPICFACTATEAKDDFKFLFMAVSDAVKKYCGVVFEPKILIADAANAIRNAFLESFESAETNIMCYVSFCSM